jgi:hypothetical protein
VTVSFADIAFRGYVFGVVSIPSRIASPAGPGWRLAWIIALAFLSGGDITAHAQLSWTNKTLELTSDSTAATLEGRFHFVNSGTKPVDILRVVTSCGCTSANLDKRHFDPGQGGDIVVTYKRGSHTGLQQNQIEVETSDQPPAMLTLLVHIPEVVRIQPAFVTWTHQEPKTPKTIALTLLVPGKITALDVQSSDPSVAVAVRPVVPGKEYRLVVSPDGANHFLRAILSITCELDGKDKKTFTSYATIQPAPVE